MQVDYQATDQLPAGVPAAVIAEHGRIICLVDRSLSIDEACAALGPLITAHAAASWWPRPEIAPTG